MKLPPLREWKPKPPMPAGCSYYVEVRDGEDPMRAYRKIKKKIKDDKFFEEIKERQYYQKPSFKFLVLQFLSLFSLAPHWQQSFTAKPSINLWE